MKQIVQTLRTGEINVEDVPVPALQDAWVLVRNTASVISAGTEKTKVDLGKKNLIQKALARPDLVKQVIKKLKTEGFAKTLQTVSTRLDAPSPLGYSSAGEVVAVGGLVKGIQVGDKVACAGAGYANHAEFVAVPKNLVVKIPAGVSDEEAAFTTLGSIALQGVRLAEPRLGERFLVLGLGLLGQIAVQLLRANGCEVFGTDLNPDMVKLAEEFGATGIYPGSDLAATCRALTEGHGVDGVIITAGTSSNQPIEVSGEACRKKGRVIVVGAVRMDIPREPYFKKEINVMISCSYGPGRYDPSYEEGGADYPLAYVRFTEQRNMQTFLQLIAQKKLDVARLITHRFPLEQAGDAYGLIEGERREPYLGIVLQYAQTSYAPGSGARIPVASAPVNKHKLGLSFLGAGNYTTATLLPVLKNLDDVELRGLVTSSGRTAQGVAKQFGFGFCAGDYAEMLKDDTDVVFVTTRHDSHARSVAEALAAGKHAYVEKPLGLNVEELQQVHAAFVHARDRQLLIGFNRRFAPLTQELLKHFAHVQSPLLVNIRVNAGAIPEDHWIQDPVQGGGRLIGEGCHFIDLAAALTRGNPVSVHAYGTAKANKSPLLNDNLCISLAFDNGSVANISYVADGAKAMAKEHMEVFGGGRSAVLDDFKSLTLYTGDTGVEEKKGGVQDKGQKAMLRGFIDGLKTGTPIVAYEAIALTSLATVAAVESLMIGAPVPVSLDVLRGDALEEDGIAC